MSNHIRNHRQHFKDNLRNYERLSLTQSSLAILAAVFINLVYSFRIKLSQKFITLVEDKKSNLIFLI